MLDRVAQFCGDDDAILSRRRALDLDHLRGVDVIDAVRGRRGGIVPVEDVRQYRRAAGIDDLEIEIVEQRGNVERRVVGGHDVRIEPSEDNADVLRRVHRERKLHRVAVV